MLLALLAAASVTAAPAYRPVINPESPKAGGVICPAAGAMKARVLRPQDRRGEAGAQTLASLPPASMEYTVARDIGGCNVPALVRQNVQGDGRFAPGR
jgi:hypothetical protein